MCVNNSNKVAWAEAYLRTKWHLDPSNRLATKTWGENCGSAPLFVEGSWIPI